MKIGYCLIEPEAKWRPERQDIGQKMSQDIKDFYQNKMLWT